MGTPNLGIADADRAKIAEGLAHLLADSYTLYLKTHKYHWNVTGPNFSGLHSLFETQYDEMNAAQDDIAERIRMLDTTVPAGLKAFGQQTGIADGDHNAKVHAMLQDLIDGHQAVIASLKTALEVAQDAGDEASADLVIGRLQAHDKHVWMLKATLKA